MVLFLNVNYFYIQSFNLKVTRYTEVQTHYQHILIFPAMFIFNTFFPQQ